MFSWESSHKPKTHLKSKVKLLVGVNERDLIEIISKAKMIENYFSSAMICVPQRNYLFTYPLRYEQDVTQGQFLSGHAKIKEPSLTNSLHILGVEVGENS